MKSKILLAISLIVVTNFSLAGNEDLPKAKKTMQEKYDAMMTEKSKDLKLRPYIGVKVKKNLEQLKDCPKRAVSEDNIDPKVYDVQKNCQCYYVQIEDLSYRPENLDHAMAVADYARKTCLQEARIAK